MSHSPLPKSMCKYKKFGRKKIVLLDFCHIEAYWKLTCNTCFLDSVLDSQPNKLMETAEEPLSLVDTGFFINTSYPPLMRPERKVDIILHLNYSGGCQILVRRTKYSAFLLAAPVQLLDMNKWLFCPCLALVSLPVWSISVLSAAYSDFVVQVLAFLVLSLLPQPSLLHHLTQITFLSLMFPWGHLHT